MVLGTLEDGMEVCPSYKRGDIERPQPILMPYLQAITTPNDIKQHEKHHGYKSFWMREEP